jgi:hypothetical protein
LNGDGRRNHAIAVPNFQTSKWLAVKDGMMSAQCGCPGT